MQWSTTPRAFMALGAMFALCTIPGVARAATSVEDACPVVASAQGVQLLASKSDDLVLQVPTGAVVPAAQACLDLGLGGSTAFASVAYPGELVLSEPQYPGYLSSTYPSHPTAQSAQPGVDMRASSGATLSEAHAGTGLAQDPGAGATTGATVRVTGDPGAGTASATASSVTEPLTIAGVLRLGHVHSSAKASIDSSGRIERSSQLEIGRTTVAGVDVALTARGLEAAGQTIGVPPSTALTDALKQAGVTVRYLAPEKTDRGVLSAGLDIQAVAHDPQSGAVSTVQYVVGRAFAAVAPVGSGVGENPTPVSGSSGTLNPGSALTPGLSGTVPNTTSGIGPIDGTGSPQLAPSGATSRLPTILAAPLALFARTIDMGLPFFYLVIVFGALVMFACGTLLRLLGVKTRWIS